MLAAILILSFLAILVATDDPGAGDRDDERPALGRPLLQPSRVHARKKNS